MSRDMLKINTCYNYYKIFNASLIKSFLILDSCLFYNQSDYQLQSAFVMHCVQKPLHQDAPIGNLLNT